MANKIKTHSGAKKRFKMTKNGKVKKACAFRKPSGLVVCVRAAMPIRPTLRLSKS